MKRSGPDAAGGGPLLGAGAAAGAPNGVAVVPGTLFPEDDEPDAHAEIVGVDSARAAKRQGHKYPRSKFAGKNEATGDVLGEVFGGDAA